MLRSRANAVISVRRVTEVNAGRKTPGVDGKVALLASQKAALADWAQRRSRLWTARPVKRVLIPKPGSAKKRQLGMPPEIEQQPIQLHRIYSAFAKGTVTPRTKRQSTSAT